MMGVGGGRGGGSGGGGWGGGGGGVGGGALVPACTWEWVGGEGGGAQPHFSLIHGVLLGPWSLSLCPLSSSLPPSLHPSCLLPPPSNDPHQA